MPPSETPEPGGVNWPGSAYWRAGNLAQRIFIPVEVDESSCITSFVVLNDQDFPAEGQNTLYDYAGSSFKETCASLTIHHELADPSLEDGYTITLLKLACSIDQSTLFSRNHAVRTAYWSRQIAARLGFGAEALDQIELAGTLHDVGKVVVPKTVLVKPACLSDQEWVIMRRHPSFGAMILNPSLRLHTLIPMIEAHHEKFDGSGYPYGLSGDQIPVGARIIAIADTFTTMTEGRVYRQPRHKSVAVEELRRFQGKQFDPRLVHAMVSLVEADNIDDTQCQWEAFDWSR